VYRYYEQQFIILLYNKYVLTRMKVKLTLLVDEDIVKKAKDIGINLSKFLEHNLKRAIIVLDESEMKR